jgi:hypothetical protein
MGEGHRAQGVGYKIKGKGKVVLRALCSMLFAFVIVFPIHAAVPDKKPALQFGKNQDVQQVKPKKPVRIKLHRNAKGEYQWDITGDNADEIVRADKRLRKLLEVEQDSINRR